MPLMRDILIYVILSSLLRHSLQRPPPRFTRQKPGRQELLAKETCIHWAGCRHYSTEEFFLHPASPSPSSTCGEDAMPRFLSFRCPACQVRIKAPVQLLGQSRACPG